MRNQPKLILFVTLLLGLMAAEMAFSVHRESVTWDEGDHLFAGYMSLHTGDFGLNPEHPPMAKMLAAIPLLALPLHVPPLQGRQFKTEAYLDGRDLLFGNEPRYSGQTLMFRARLAVSLFALGLALLVFFTAREMFGPGAGLLALALAVLEPNLLTHGPLVTTDTAISCMFLLTVWSVYRWVQKPSRGRLIIAGFAAGLALAAKHSGLVVLASLVPLLLGDVLLQHLSQRRATDADRFLWRRNVARYAVGVAVITVVAMVVLWAFYGFRYQARPAGLALAPTLDNYVLGIRPLEARSIVLAGHLHLLPESWLYGLADVRLVANNMPTYFFGKVYAHGLWIYFPAVLLIKLTLGTLGLLAMAAWATARGLVQHQVQRPREVLFLLVPAAFYLLIAMGSGLNIGMRHVLPIVPLLLIFAAGGAIALARRSRPARIAVAVLLLAHAASSLRAFPLYLPYSNEAWGGSRNTWRYLSDSNTDWGQQLISVDRWLSDNKVNDCSFAYFVTPFILPADYGIRCRLMPTFDSSNMIDLDVAPTVSGTLLISAGDLNGFEWGTAVRNPYQPLVGRRPDAVIDDGVFVFHGTFYLPDAAAIAPTQRSIRLLKANDAAGAVREARAALALSPNNFDALLQLGSSLAAEHDAAGADAAFHGALAAINRMEPSAQAVFRPQVEAERQKLSAENR